MLLIPAGLCQADDKPGETSFGFALGQATIASQGYFVGTVPVSPFLSMAIETALSNNLYLNFHTETSSNVYFNSGAMLRYFPLSLGNTKSSANNLFSVTYYDTFRPFLGLGFSLGKVRLETKDQLGATEISAVYYGPDLSIGLVSGLSKRWALDLNLTYGILMASADSAIAFNGSKISFAAGVIYQL